MLSSAGIDGPDEGRPPWVQGSWGALSNSFELKRCRPRSHFASPHASYGSPGLIARSCYSHCTMVLSLEGLEGL